MKAELLTIEDVEKAAQALIDSIADDIFVEGCQAVESVAEISRQAREEEDGKEDEADA